MVNGYRGLQVWQKSIDLVDAVYHLVSSFPPDERFRLTDQLIRACISIPANIAEGSSRGGTKEYIQFINISKGSLAELETHLLIAKRRGYIMDGAYAAIINDIDYIDAMLFRLKQSLQRRLKISSTEHRTLNTEHA